MNYAKRITFPSSFRVVNVVKNTKNGSLIRMALLGKPSLEGTSIFVSSQLPHTKIATQLYNEVASLSELKHQITVKNEAE